MPRIDSEPHRHFHRLIGLRERGLLDDLERLSCLIRGCDIAVLRRDIVLLPMRMHQSTTSTPIERAAPATIAIADSIESQFRLGNLISAILRICALVTLPTFVRLG